MSRVAVHASADVGAPAEKVWPVLVDWPRHAEWVPFTRAEGGAATGEPIEAWTGIGPVGFLDTMIIAEWTPPHRIAVRHTGRLVRGEGRFDLLDVPGGRCRVTWSELIDLPLEWRNREPVRPEGLWSILGDEVRQRPGPR